MREERGWTFASSLPNCGFGMLARRIAGRSLPCRPRSRGDPRVLSQPTAGRFRFGACLGDHRQLHMADVGLSGRERQVCVAHQEVGSPYRRYRGRRRRHRPAADDRAMSRSPRIDGVCSAGGNRNSAPVRHVVAICVNSPWIWASAAPACSFDTLAVHRTQDVPHRLRAGRGGGSNRSALQLDPPRYRLSLIEGKQ